MKRMLAFLLILVTVLMAACGQVTEPEKAPEPVPATQPEKEMEPAPVTQPEEHECASACDFCGGCTDVQCQQTVCSEKCPGEHGEEVYQFSNADYITEEAVSIDTGTLVFDIGENVYVPDNLTGMAESLASAIEKVSGLDFDGVVPYARETFPDGKVHIKVSRDSLYAGNPEYSWCTGLQTSEYGSAHAGAWEHVELSPGDLFLGNSYAIVHELGHMLMYRQSEWRHSQLLNEGFAEYTTYLALKELEKTDPETAVYLEPATYAIANMEIYDYEKLYEQPLEYWFENTFEYSANQNYTVGFRFMSYLQDVYGDYSKWIVTFEQMYSFRQKDIIEDQSSVQRQIEVLKAAYGSDVLEGFYPWLKEHTDLFEASLHWDGFVDRTVAEKMNLYPVFNALESRAKLERFAYNDLYINLEPLRKYIGEYKQCDTAELMLVTSEPVEVRLYQPDGTFTTVMSDSQNGIPMEGISYIKLVGNHQLYRIEIIGDFRVIWE